jgi:LysM repeat protein
MWRVVLVMAFLILGAQVVSAQDQVYVVQRGDTLQRIANHYGVPLNAIVSYNQIVNPSRIYPGQRIVIPSSWGHNPPPPSSGTQYVVKPGDTLRKIADWYGTTWRALAAYNNIPNPNRIYAGMVIYIPSGGYVPPAPQPPAHPNVYYVRYGDTMLRIASYFGVNVWRLAEANGIYNLNHIYAGQRLIIP